MTHKNWFHKPPLMDPALQGLPIEDARAIARERRAAKIARKQKLWEDVDIWLSMGFSCDAVAERFNLPVQHVIRRAQSQQNTG